MLTPTGTREDELPLSTGWRKTFSALRNPNYRYFYSGQIVALIGTWIRTAALGWVTFRFTRSEFLLGIVFGGGMPIGSLWMGLLASRTSSGFSLQMGGLFCVLGALSVYWFFRR